MDVPDCKHARVLADELGDSVTFYKIGLELLMTGDAFAFADELVEQGKEVFMDLKLFDVPNTVAGAVARIEAAAAVSRAIMASTVSAMRPRSMPMSARV